MKKSVSLLLAGAMCAGLLAGCSSSSTSGGASAAASGSTAPSSVVSGEAGSKSIEKLSIAFVPSREPEEIITATEPLKQMLTDELAKLVASAGQCGGHTGAHCLFPPNLEAGASKTMRGVLVTRRGSRLPDVAMAVSAISVC